MPCISRQSKRPRNSDSDNSSDGSENGLCGHRLTRQERCRLSAKARRDAELEEFRHLGELLPIPRDVVSNLDKGSILRLSICYLQLKDITNKELDSSLENGQHRNGNNGHAEPDFGLEEPMEEGALMLDAMDGFLLFVDSKGQVLYISEQVEEHIGIPQVDLIGNPILGLIHPKDRQEFAKQFFDQPANIPNTAETHELYRKYLEESEDITDGEPNSQGQGRLFYVRMKTFCVKPGTKTKVTQYVLTEWSGRLHQSADEEGKLVVRGLVAIIRPIHTTSLMEIRLDGSVFISRHDLDLRYTFCDPRVLNLLGYEPSELLGKTCFTFHNPLDEQKVVACHADLISKGTAVSRCYRFLGKNGSWVWMLTRATIIYNANKEPQYVVCQNYVQRGRQARECEEEELRGKGQLSVVPAFIDLTYRSGLPGGARDCIPNDDDETNSILADTSNEGSSNNATAPGVTPVQNVNTGLFMGSPIAPLPPGVVPAEQCYQNGGLSAMTMLKKPSSGSLKGSKGSMNSLMDFNTDDIFLSEEALDLGDVNMQWYTGNELERLAEEAAANQVLPERANDGHMTADYDNTIHTTLAAANNDHAYSAKPRDSPIPCSSSGGRPMSQGSSTNSVQMSSSGFLPGLVNSSSGSDVEMLEDAFLGVPVSQPPIQQSSPTTTATSVNAGQASDSILVSLLGETDKKKGKRPAAQGVFKQPLPPRSQNSDSFPRSTSMRISLHSVPTNLFSLGSETCAGNVETDGDIIQKLADALVAQQAQENLAQMSGQMPLNDTSDLFTNLPASGITTAQQGSFAPSVANIGAELFPSLNDGSNLFSTYNAPISSAVPFSSYQSTNSHLPDTRPSHSQVQSPPRVTQSSSWASKKNAPSLQTYRIPTGITSPTETPTPTKTTLLEKFLTTDKPLNPNKGSDAAFSENVTEQISHLNITEGDTNLLKQLLTGEIDGHKVQQFEQSLILNRKQKEDSPSPSPQVQMNMPKNVGIPHLATAVNQSDVGAGVELFGAETAGDLENIWGSMSSSDMEMLMHSDLDDILREQMRQEDLWLREYFDDI